MKKKATAILKATLGPHDTLTFNVRYSEANDMYILGYTLQGIPVLRELLADMNATNDSNNDTLSTEVKLCLARCLIDKDDFSEAEELLCQVIDIQERKHGQLDSKVIGTKLTLIKCWSHQGRDEEALNLSHNLLSLTRDPTALYLIARTMTCLSDYVMAEKICRQLLDYTRWPSQEFRNLAVRVTGLLGTIYIERDLYAEAEYYLRQSIWYSSNYYGKRHRSTFSALERLTMMYVQQRRYDDFQELALSFLDDMRQELGDTDATVLNMRWQFYQVWHWQGRIEEAKILATELRNLSRDHGESLDEWCQCRFANLRDKYGVNPVVPRSVTRNSRGY